MEKLINSEIKLPAIFTDGMILQRMEPCPVWGWDSGKGIVKVCFRDRKYTVKTDADGKWKVNVESGEAGGPFILAVQGSDRIEISNVYVGEVWLVSGQSNAGQTPNEPYGASAAHSPSLRFHTVGCTNGNISSKWVSAGAVAMFAWHFGHELRKCLQVPVGIIISAVGGTCIEQWKPGPDPGIAQAGPAGEVKGEAGGLYDNMIVPLQPYRIKGVIWWQGESNADNADSYYHKFTSLIGIWRHDWGQGNFPFLWVQLQRIIRNGPDWWLRIADGRSTISDAQRRALSVVNTAMVVAHDITEGDLHPPDHEKKHIACRMALAAETLAYDGAPEGTGLLPSNLIYSKDMLTLTFDNTAGGLEVKDNLTVSSVEVKGFEIKPAEGDFSPACAMISGKEVHIPVHGLKPPFSVRYAWGPMPQSNLYGKSGLPVPTFILEGIV